MGREKNRRQPPPLDAESLESLALRYVERYATTEMKLSRYLTRKLRERGWSGERDAGVADIVRRLAALRYVDDRSFGEARASGLERRGFGARRVTQDLRAAGIAEDIRSSIVGSIDAQASALTYARRRRFGPFGGVPLTRELRQKQFAAMLRAGHDSQTVARILGAGDADLLYDE